MAAGGGARLALPHPATPQAHLVCHPHAEQRELVQRGDVHHKACQVCKDERVGAARDRPVQRHSRRGLERIRQPARHRDKARVACRPQLALKQAKVIEQRRAKQQLAQVAEHKHLRRAQRRGAWGGGAGACSRRRHARLPSAPGPTPPLAHVCKRLYEQRRAPARGLGSLHHDAAGDGGDEQRLGQRRAACGGAAAGAASGGRRDERRHDAPRTPASTPLPRACAEGAGSARAALSRPSPPPHSRRPPCPAFIALRAPSSARGGGGGRVRQRVRRVRPLRGVAHAPRELQGRGAQGVGGGGGGGGGEEMCTGVAGNKAGRRAGRASRRPDEQGRRQRQASR